MMFLLLPTCHSVDGGSVDPEKGNEGKKSHPEDDAHDDAGTDVGILASILGELSPEKMPLLLACGIEKRCETLQACIDACVVRPRCGFGSLAGLRRDIHPPPVFSVCSSPSRTTEFSCEECRQLVGLGPAERS